MLQIQLRQIQPVNFRCRFEMMAADAPSGHDFCVFDFPGCKGCPKAQHTVRTVGSSEDPMKSEALRAWLRALPAPKNSFSLQSGRSATDTEKYVQRENLALSKKRLAEAHSDAEREVLLKLRADEEAKEPPHSQAALICTNEHRSGSIKYGSALGPPMPD